MSLYSRRSVTWRYLPGRTVKHALQTSDDAIALCGTSPRWFIPRAEHWYGTGRQTEYEQVERLPECRRCASRLGPPPDTAPAQLPSAPAAESATSQGR